MPPKVGILERQLKKAGFIYFAGKGSHRKYIHPTGEVVVISGNAGKDAHHYQVKMVQDAISLVEK